MLGLILGSMTRLTNDQFAEMVGCDFTTASKLKTGARMPSAALLAAIREAFHLDGNELMDAYSQGAVTFSAYLRDKIFAPQEIGSVDQDPNRVGG